MPIARLPGTARMTGANGSEEPKRPRGGGDDRFEARRETSLSGGGSTVTRQFFEQLVLPVATRSDAGTTCSAVRRYVDPSDGQIVVVHVIEQSPGYPDKLPLDAALDRAEAVVGSVADSLAEYRVRTDVRYGPNVVEEICGAAEAADATAIGFTPRRGRRWVRLLTGDVSTKLVMAGARPIVVFPPTDFNGVSPVEGANTEERRSVDNRREVVVLPIASLTDAEVTCQTVLPYLPDGSRVVVVHVIRRHDHRTGQRDRALAESRETRARHVLTRAVERLEAASVPTDTRLVHAVDVVAAIDEVATAEAADAVVFTPRESSRWLKLLSGDLTDGLIRRSNRPVIVVPGDRENERR